MEITTVSDLIAELNYYDGDLPIMVATQPSYPMQASIMNVEKCAATTGEWKDGDEVEEDRVYLAISDHSHGCPREAWGE